MKRIIDLNTIKHRWNAMELMSCKPNFNKVKENHVFDEDKSVKWNREQVIINNEKYDSEVKRLNTLKNKERDAIYEDIYTYIQQEVGHNLSRNKAKAIFDFVWDNHKSINEITYDLNEAIGLISNILTPEKERKQSQKDNEEDYER